MTIAEALRILQHHRKSYMPGYHNDFTDAIDIAIKVLNRQTISDQNVSKPTVRVR